MPSKPHLVLFNPDQWRGDVLGHVGNPAAVTPNLDRLVRTDAVSFRNAFCQNTVCTPSRCSFMSGWYPHVRGHRIMHYMMRPDEPVLLGDLKEAGYFVWWGGKNDLIPADADLDKYCDVRYRPSKPVRPGLHDRTEWRGDPGEDTYYSFFAGRLEPCEEGVLADRDWANVHGAVERIRNHPPDRPLCVYLPLGYPHPPYGVEEPWYGMIDRDRLPDRIPTPEGWAGKPAALRAVAEAQGMTGWGEQRWTELRATYYGMCARVDHQFGLVIDALREAGMYDDTAILFFADHGDFTGDYGLVEKMQNTFEDCLSRVPLVVKPPSDVPVRPRVCDGLAELIDVPATVYELTGIEPRHWHFGRSLLPAVAGETEEHRDAVFCEGGRLLGEGHCREAQSVEPYADPAESQYWPRLRTQLAEGPEHGKAVMCRTKRHKYVRRLYENDELYDLCMDPRELDNRSDDPALSDVRQALTERMLTWFVETADVVPFEQDER